jgi:hypothetical protein
MTYLEISTFIKAYNKRERYSQQLKASMDYKLADLISTGIGSLLSKEVTFPTLFESYEGVFDKELEAELKNKQLEQRQKEQVERIKAMVLSHSNDYKNVRG